jgi:chromate transport protein ChrA
MGLLRFAVSDYVIGVSFPFGGSMSGWLATAVAFLFIVLPSGFNIWYFAKVLNQREPFFLTIRSS